ncbi:malonate decarboxylase holo-[acyl-carrier-protein] synthase [Bradyrhizobium diazoefficiens]|uniref:Putative malonate decarboxylase n=1 Tax=Bradyrhizobium diazoefficiens SEMIA 5080 TaxID=754504 RepID=A0A837C914_9BRAD|nr:malonate decarboxylase holo-[acyl-carrier-protein] synthase [Bradyrhizobium diazoefficiens]APO49888.1 phosphoribosyl-dephospho-CoA transferase [Bradyrhizobium diazoefficiens]KGJ65730.1 putative malonate decarboxylase [Bradyrhizobium diazoefficiens SEMIA 5080]KOY07386.1 phosphoribosyl-dephospho-CoA transferase [Bradyrhizobium diazoefficiens]MCD9295815.1 malonate decarboxylase holo-[acyl-carrier-protein] synthase [Bradyrhizobium diazoefficiens]MCD9810324.1 malonate decarboxylase holo-[acyl-ca
MAEALARHTMVKASAAGWAAVMSRHPELASEPIIDGWARADRPLIVRRPACSDAAGMIPLGLPLPPSHGKRRIAFALAPGDIIAWAPPPSLADAAAAAPARWRETIGLLLQLLPETRTFGSLAWQHLTGLPYLSDSSDLDLLWPLSSARQADTLPSDIGRIANRAPMRLDGEIVGRAGGVQWRELIGADDDEVLVKGPAGVISTTRAAFLTGSLS